MKINKNLALAVIAFAVLGIILAGCREKPSQDYFPMGVGSYWEYNVLAYLPEGATKMSKEIIKVIGKERIDTLECYIVDRYTIEGKVPSFAQYREYLAKTDEGVFCTKRAFPMMNRLKKYFPSLQVDILHADREMRFKNKLKDGDNWKWEGIVNLELLGDEKEGQDPKNLKPPTIKQVKGSMEFKYLGRETIRVMNTDYECIKISFFGKSEAGQEIESTTWYAPGIGRVREEQKFFQGSDSVSYLFELTSYNITNREPFQGKQQ